MIYKNSAIKTFIPADLRNVMQPNKCKNTYFSQVTGSQSEASVVIGGDVVLVAGIEQQQQQRRQR